MKLKTPKKRFFPFYTISPKSFVSLSCSSRKDSFFPDPNTSPWFSRVQVRVSKTSLPSQRTQNERLQRCENGISKHSHFKVKSRDTDEPTTRQHKTRYPDLKLNPYIWEGWKRKKVVFWNSPKPEIFDSFIHHLSLDRSEIISIYEDRTVDSVRLTADKVGKSVESGCERNQSESELYNNYTIIYVVV